MQHFSNFLSWLELDPSLDSWQRWHDSNQETIRNSTVAKRFRIYLSRTAIARFINVLSAMAAFEVSELPPTSVPYQREQLSISLGIGAVASAVLLFFIADSGSTRRLVKVPHP